MALKNGRYSKLVRQIAFTLLIIAVFEAGQCITVPGLVSISSDSDQYKILEMISLISGGALTQMSLFSLGVGPFITSGIVTDMAGYAFKLFDDGDEKSKKKKEKLSKMITLGIALFQSFVLVWSSISHEGNVTGDILFCADKAFIITAGSMALLWFADQISVHGIGNGVSVIILVNVVSYIPSQITQAFSETESVMWKITYVILMIAVLCAVIAAETAEKRIPILQSSRAVYGKPSESSYLPIRMNSASVIPVIFSSMIVQALLFLNVFDSFSSADTILDIIDIVLIIAFTFIYSNIQVNPGKTAEQLILNEQYLPGIKPGKDTEKEFFRILNSVTCLGAFNLVVVSLAPAIISYFTPFSMSCSPGGTSYILIAGVSAEIISEIRSVIHQNRYRGF